MATWPTGLAEGNYISVFIFLILAGARPAEATPTFNLQHLGWVSDSALNDLPQRFRSSLHILAALTRQHYVRAISGQLGAWDMVQLIAACTLIGGFRHWKQQRKALQESKATKLLGSEVRKSFDSSKESSRDLNGSSKSGGSTTSSATTSELNNVSLISRVRCRENRSGPT